MRAHRAGVKLNTDGCFYESNGKAGFGGLFRDHDGQWLLGFYGKLTCDSSLETEIWGIYRGLTIMLERGYNNIHIESDSLSAVQLINGDHPSTHPLNSLIGDSRLLLRRTQFQISHIFREANTSADHLARLGAEQQEAMVVTEESPQSVRIFVRDDWLGRSHVRD